MGDKIEYFFENNRNLLNILDYLVAFLKLWPRNRKKLKVFKIYLTTIEKNKFKIKIFILVDI